MKPHTLLPATIEGRVGKYCTSRPEIVAAYLFGSFARGEAGPLSDLDLAFLIDHRRERLAGSLTYQAARLSDLIRLLDTNDVELVVLPTSSPLLQHRILRDSRLLYCHDHRQRVAFECKALQTYLDLKPFYERQTRRFFEQLRTARLGAVRHG
jgi:predicted nucleotidyltransferase